MRGFPTLSNKSSRQIDSWWRNLSTEELEDVRVVWGVLGCSRCVNLAACCSYIVDCVVEHEMTRFLSSAQDDLAIFEPSALCVRSALEQTAVLNL